MNLKLIFTVAIMSASMGLLAGDKSPPPTSPKEALTRLMAGNQRYIKEVLEHPNRSIEHIETLVENQTPFAIVLGCSDSRTSPIIIFDQGIGDLFEVRVAGNVAGPIEIASIEFAALNLGSKLILVMGHENCGAVKAVLDHNTKDIEPIANNIEAAIKEFSHITGNNLESAIKANVTGVVKQLRANPVLAKLIADKKLDIIGGYYKLDTGQVEICCDIR